MGTAREQLLILITTPIYLIVIGLELFLSKLKRQDSYSFKDTAQNIYFMLLNGGIDLLFRVIYIGFILSFFYDHRIVQPIKNPWLYWFVLLIFEDFMYYWLHRVDHICRIFWAKHVTHHSSPKFNLTVGFDLPFRATQRSLDLLHRPRQSADAFLDVDLTAVDSRSLLTSIRHCWSLRFRPP